MIIDVIPENAKGGGSVEQQQLGAKKPPPQPVPPLHCHSLHSTPVHAASTSPGFNHAAHRGCCPPNVRGAVFRKQAARLINRTVDEMTGIAPFESKPLGLFYYSPPPAPLFVLPPPFQPHEQRCANAWLRRAFVAPRRGTAINRPSNLHPGDEEQCT